MDYLGSYLTNLLSGISIGSIYALVGLGMYLVIKVSRTLNLAHGGFIMLGSLLTFTFVDSMGMPYMVAALLLIVIGLILGGILYSGIVRPIYPAGQGPVLIALIMVGIVLTQVSTLIWGKDPLPLPSFTGNTVYRLGKVVVVVDQMIVVCLLVILLILTWLFFNYTKIGKGIAALGFDREGAAVIGINIARLEQFVWAVSIALGMLSGLIYSSIGYAGAIPGIILTVNGFIALVIGGTSSPYAPVIGGVVLGIVESFLGRWLDAGGVTITLMGLLLILLLVSPNGIASLLWKEGRKRGIDF